MGGLRLIGVSRCRLLHVVLIVIIILIIYCRNNTTNNKPTTTTSAVSVGTEDDHHRLSSSSSSSSRLPDYWPKYNGGRNHVVKLLDGIWETGRIIDENELDIVANAHWIPPLPNTEKPKLLLPNLTHVPSCVDADAPPGYLGFRGVTLFRTYFDLEYYDLHHQSVIGAARLVFQACSFYCRIWVNDKYIGEHRNGGYVAFYVDIPPIQQLNTSKNNTLTVLVDNRFNSTTAPLHTIGDYWQYGGIIRSVELHYFHGNKDDVDDMYYWPWRMYILPQSLSTVQITLHLLQSSSSSLEESDNDVNKRIVRKKKNVTVSLQFDTQDQPQDFTGTIIENNTTNDIVVDLGIVDVPNPRVWSTTNPQLHTVTVTLNGAVLQERFGLRMFSVDNTTHRLTLNGQVLKLVGWNHHTQWPQTGASPTDAQLDDDIRLLKNANVNFVRGAHYPQDPRWLDRLDENGILCWSETLGAGVSVNNATNPIFMKHQFAQLQQMLYNALNHPSIFIWGFFNEGPAYSEDACPAYTACTNLIKQHDNTRFVSWASNMLERDKCLHAATLIAFNNYPGWYNNEEPKPFWNRQARNVRAGTIAGSAGKPFLISETGAGGIYEWADNQTAARWTLRYQTHVVASDVEEAISNPNISGIALWHFFDFKTHDDTENNTHCDYLPNVYPPICSYIHVTNHTRRPGGLNHKGAVDYWRRLKPVYSVVAAMYKNANTVSTGHSKTLLLYAIHLPTRMIACVWYRRPYNVLGSLVAVAAVLLLVGIVVGRRVTGSGRRRNYSVLPPGTNPSR